MAGDLPVPGRGSHDVLGSPQRMLVGTILYVGVLFVAATLGYMAAGWTLGDAAYMVLLTIFSVGFGEVRPIDTMYLRGLTSITIVLGCTGMIVLTGALVQVFTLFQFRRMMGLDRMMTDIQKLDDHVIICGFGRIGVQLAKALGDARRGFVIVERSVEKANEAKAMGLLCIVGEATDEDTLKLAGVDKARVLATVLPDDAANVFITLSARSLTTKGVIRPSATGRIAARSTRTASTRRSKRDPCTPSELAQAESRDPRSTT